MVAEDNPGRAHPRAGAGKPVHALAEGTRHIERTARPKEAGTPYRITSATGEPFRIVVSGRVRWAFDRLRAAGAMGCTPITEPAPLWSAYVFSLRDVAVAIETITEPHGGEFARHHARYVLRCQAAPDWTGGAT